MSSSDQALAYIRGYYRVPARRGRRILYTGGDGGSMHFGTITGGADAHLIVRFDHDPKRKHRLHPTWCVQYLERMWRCTGCGKWSHAHRRPTHHAGFRSADDGHVEAIVGDGLVVDGRAVIDRVPATEDSSGGWMVECGPFEQYEARLVTR